MENKILGVLGGMGPQASALFYERLIARTQAETDQEHARVLLWGESTIPDRTAGILSGEVEPVYEALLAGLKLLEGVGCTALVMTCNTAHYFADRLQANLSVPLIHMPRETVTVVQAAGHKKVAVLATDGTVRTGIYQTELEKAGLTAVTPPEDLQKTIMEIIYREIKRGLPGSTEKFAKVEAWLKEEACDCAILGCTELSVYRAQEDLPAFYIDAMEVLVEKSILHCGKQLKGLV